MQNFKEHTEIKDMTSPKEYNNFPVTDFKEMEIYEFPKRIQNNCFEEPR